MSDQTPKPQAKGVSAGGMQVTPKTILALVIALAALIFIFSNTGEFTLSFLWLTFTAPEWMMLLILFLAGLLVGFFSGRNRYKSR